MSCDELHEEEIFAKAELDFGPDELFPGEGAIGEMVSAELCDDATVDFAGACGPLRG